MFFFIVLKSKSFSKTRRLLKNVFYLKPIQKVRDKNDDHWFENITKIEEILFGRVG